MKESKWCDCKEPKPPIKNITKKVPVASYQKFQESPVCSKCQKTRRLTDK